VCALRLSDATCGVFAVNTAGSRQQFTDFLSLGLGECVTVAPADFGFFASVSRELGNDEVFAALVGRWTSDSGRIVENVLGRLRLGGSLCGGVSCESEVGFIASHAFEMAESDLRGLGCETLSSVLSHPSLRIASDDWLCDFVVGLCEGDASHACLLDLVRFEFMSADAVRAFVERSEGFIVDYMSAGLWRALGLRLSATASLGAPGGRRRQRSPLDESKPLDGVIAHLTRAPGGSVADTGAVSVTASATYSDNPDHAAKNAADLEADSFWHSKNEPCQWLCYDFKERRVQPAAYSMKSDNSSAGYHHPKSWVVEVSNDGLGWSVVDRREDNSDLNGARVTKAFVVDVSGAFRMIRVRQTGKTYHGSDYVALTGFEVFGDLFE